MYDDVADSHVLLEVWKCGCPPHAIYIQTQVTEPAPVEATDVGPLG